MISYWFDQGYMAAREGEERNPFMPADYYEGYAYAVAESLGPVEDGQMLVVVH